MATISKPLNPDESRKRIAVVAFKAGHCSVEYEGAKSQPCYRPDLDSAPSFLEKEPESYVRLLTVDYPLSEKHYTQLRPIITKFHVHELRFGHHSGVSQVRPTVVHGFILGFAFLQRLAFYPPLCRGHLTDELLEECAKKGVITLGLPDEPPEDGGLYDITENGVLDYCFGLPHTDSRWIRVDHFHVTGGFFGKLLRSYRNSENTAEVAIRISSALPIVSMDTLAQYARHRRYGVSNTKLYFEFTGDLQLQVAMTLCRTIMWIQRGKNPTVFQTRVLHQETAAEVNNINLTIPVAKRTSRTKLPSETFLHVFAHLSAFDLDAVAFSNRHQRQVVDENPKYLPLRRIKTLKLSGKTCVTAVNDRRLVYDIDFERPHVDLQRLFAAVRHSYVREFLLALACFPAVVDRLARGLRETHVDELRLTNFSAIHCVPAKSLHKFILCFPSVRAICTTAQRLRQSHITDAFLEKCAEKGITNLELECQRPIACSEPAPGAKHAPPEDPGGPYFGLSGEALLDFAFHGTSKAKRVIRMNNLRLEHPQFFESLIEKSSESNYQGDIVLVVKSNGRIVDDATIAKYEALGFRKEGENNFTVFDFLGEDRRLQIALPPSGRVLLASRTVKINGHPFFF